jgi:hypothetical protein
LQVNPCVSFGLYNGVIGKIIDIIYLEGNIPENSLPAAEASLHDNMLFCILLEQEELLLTVVDLVLVLLFVVN